MKCNAVTPIYSITNMAKNKAFYFGQYAKNKPTKEKLTIVNNDIDRLLNELNVLLYCAEKGLFVDERV